MSEIKFDELVNLDELTKPFPATAHKQRKSDGNSGKMLTYVEGHTVIHRLNDATGNHWDFEVRAIDSTNVGADRNGNPRLLWKVRGALTLPGLGTRENIGVQVASLGTGEDLIKGAITDCIKKCATLFGVGLELYGPDYESDDFEPAPSPRAPQRPPVDHETGEVYSAPPRQQTTHYGNGNADRVAAAQATHHERGDTPDQPCAIEGCEGVCNGSWVGFSMRRYGVPLCSRHSAAAKRGDLDDVLASLQHN